MKYRRTNMTELEIIIKDKELQDIIIDYLQSKHYVVIGKNTIFEGLEESIKIKTYYSSPQSVFKDTIKGKTI